MGGGLMQLVTYGSQDVYLTGNPQVTFFKVVYRRHTNFSMEAIEQPFNSGVTPDAGLINTCIIGSSGDLVHDIWIEDRDNSASHGDIYKYIDNVEVEIGGQLIDKQHGDWNAVWWNLTTPESKVGGFIDCFMGNIDAAGGVVNRYYWYPLQFWFCKNIGLALPLIALQYSEVKLKIKWGSESRVSSNAVVLVNYIFLDTDERRRFAQVSHEYLIEQVQRIHGPANTQKIDLNFEHPVKELIWVNDNTAPENSSGATCNFKPMGSPTDSRLSDQLKCKIQFNGDDRFSFRPSRYFKTVQPLQYHTRVPGELGPIKQKRFVMGEGTHTSSSATPTTVPSSTTLAIGTHISFLKDIVILETTMELLGVTNGNTQTTLSLVQGDHAVSSGHNTLTSPEAKSKSATMTTDPDQTLTMGRASGGSHVAAGNALGPQFDTTSYSGSAMTFDLIIMTIKYREKNELIGGNSNHGADIYVYSFALKPEEHQPSGTCNFSRVDNAKLITADADFGLSTNTYKIFAHNYNVFRVMSGMGGLAYSN